ncbi:MAG: hypothetical protein HYX79_02330 [Chloroflexi bacterium]|nr:hypothetical protein [Chloroflexota bacterium]
MDIDEERISNAVRQTEILRAPRQSLATFGTTNIYYYLLTEPVYSDLVKSGPAETVIREGKVLAEKPRIVTPYYLTRLEGFSPSARSYFEKLCTTLGQHAPGLFYTYRNEPKQLNIVSDSMSSVVSKINADIDKRGDPLAAIIKGEDQLWDVSLMKFIYELTTRSLPDNVSQLAARGLLETDSRGVPADTRLRIDRMFAMAANGEVEPRELRDELERWDLFSEYEDRFFALFRK